ncbi:MAG: ATP-dependent DNA helicase RecG [Patescibacteria group bacterium]
MLKWDDPSTFVRGVTARERRALGALGVSTVGELLDVMPRRYDDYSRLLKINQLTLNEPVTLKAKIKEIKQAPTFRRRFVIIKAVVYDETGEIGVTWFNQPWLPKQLKADDEIYLSGSVTQRPRFGRGFTSPLWEPATAETLAAGNIAPVYPLSGPLTQKTIRKVMRAALDEAEFPDEWLEGKILERLDLPQLPQAYRDVHHPESLEQAERGRRRFAFGELFLYQLALRLARLEADTAGAPAIKFDEPFAKKFAASLPFELTADQKKSVWAAVKDLESPRPMRRLLQGDVGSGKTVVAAMLAALVFRTDASAALMAPTDILAKQHAATLRRFLEPHQIPVMLLTSNSRILFGGGEEHVFSADEARERLARGRIVAVGTHALLERGQAPPDLALAVVDEQHRFGVAQREALLVASRPDGKVPHLLSMSATPIPRSLALTFLGDLEVSVIREKPKGRPRILTRLCQGEEGRHEAYSRIMDEAALGHRTFVVCPLIDPSDKLGVKSVEAEAERLQKGPLRGLRIGVLHGRLPAKDKDERMREFVSGAIDVLVATTVIEVGVDVPQATVMLIEGAERFGLAQLHQLRGRVGRSNLQSYCLLAASEDAGVGERLRVLERTDDGFEVAEADLKLRGAGNILGTEQSGAPIFKTARPDDLVLMAAAREVSKEILDGDAELEKHQDIRRRILELRETTHRE